MFSQGVCDVENAAGSIGHKDAIVVNFIRCNRWVGFGSAIQDQWWVDYCHIIWNWCLQSCVVWFICKKEKKIQPQWVRLKHVITLLLTPPTLRLYSLVFILSSMVQWNPVIKGLVIVRSRVSVALYLKRIASHRAPNYVNLDLDRSLS